LQESNGIDLWVTWIMLDHLVAWRKEFRWIMDNDFDTLFEDYEGK